jgi:hypothetical protein
VDPVPKEPVTFYTVGTQDIGDLYDFEARVQWDGWSTESAWGIAGNPVTKNPYHGLPTNTKLDMMAHARAKVMKPVDGKSVHGEERMNVFRQAKKWLELEMGSMMAATDPQGDSKGNYFPIDKSFQGFGGKIGDRSTVTSNPKGLAALEKFHCRTFGYRIMAIGLHMIMYGSEDIDFQMKNLSTFFARMSDYEGMKDVVEGNDMLDKGKHFCGYPEMMTRRNIHWLAQGFSPTIPLIVTMKAVDKDDCSVDSEDTVPMSPVPIFKGSTWDVPVDVVYRARPKEEKEEKKEEKKWRHPGLDVQDALEAFQKSLTENDFDCDCSDCEAELDKNVCECSGCAGLNKAHDHSDASTNY